MAVLVWFYLVMKPTHRRAARYVTALFAVVATVFVALPSSLAQPPTVTQPSPTVPVTSAPAGPGSDRGPDKLQPDGTSAVDFRVPVDNEIVRLRTHFTVPPKPPRVGTLFLWPGVEPRPDGRNYEPIGLGVLQPVLTWGPSCAPTRQPPAYSTWWISGQYVNVGNDPRYEGCHSGTAMSVKVGEVLDIDIALDPASGRWQQTITGQSGSVRYSINMRGQAQNRALFAVEPWDNAQYGGPLLFSDTTIDFRNAGRQSCLDPHVVYIGAGGRISQPTALDERRCHIDTVSVNSRRTVE
ncbi:hypothetical protein [Nocardia iowensis]|uniref:Secreted protein n=2 Tax=Nocardia iowensis TaxID=204891 RepID=A0ABX8RMB9_NOCIO|nr:hypothetical protein [Nocardia iowensis]QXN90064.1 hypothetical protein KV110_32210 [Nocardia iowensis]